MARKPLTEEQREAARLRSRAWYAANRERVAARERKRVRENPGLSTERVRAWREENRDRANAYERERYHGEDAEQRARRLARGKVNDAIRRGALDRKGCEVCGDDNSQAHHDDYSKPLDVRWLCSRHHADEHMAVAA